MEKMKIGIIGCGNISGTYFENCSRKFKALEVVACADIIHGKALEKAKEYNITKAYTVDELLKDPDIQLVVNLTVPQVHAAVSMRILEADKHVYNEKPLSISREEGRAMLDYAKSKNLRVGCAPDTFLGGGLQTCRKLIDDGWIGKPLAANAFLMCLGPESWHPGPEFFYMQGAGPLFDMGPYYLTALVSLLGPVSRVTGSAKITFPERVATSPERYGEKIKVEVPTHIAGVLDFENGVVGTLVTSFDVPNTKTPSIEIHGSEGTLSLPYPDTFGGPVLISRCGSANWSEIPLTHGYTDSCRGLGVADMAHALQNGREHRATGEMAYHVLDIMLGLYDASSEGRHYKLQSSCRRPSPLVMESVL